jgi:glycosyltransferase involved in cell wall biosynthesis
LGAGVQNKVLEYMALGLPTVTTSMGLEGLHAINGQDLIVADDKYNFSNAVIQLLSDRDQAEKIAKAARLYVQENHSWQSILRPLVDLVKSYI